MITTISDLPAMRSTRSTARLDQQPERRRRRAPGHWKLDVTLESGVSGNIGHYCRFAEDPDKPGGVRGKARQPVR
jgi:hypothetical protein